MTGIIKCYVDGRCISTNRYWSRAKRRRIIEYWSKLYDGFEVSILPDNKSVYEKI